MKKLKSHYVSAAAVVLLAICTTSKANEVVSAKPKESAVFSVTIEYEEGETVQEPQGRTLATPSQLSDKIRTILNLPNVEVYHEASGDGNHPFTTKRASAEDTQLPTNLDPWRSAGKLFMTKNNSSFVCSATVIKKGLLVTAAHCIHEFGLKDAGWVDSITFDPARHELSRPFGSWKATKWWIPKAYFDGSDVCSQDAPGIVCENDIAVVQISENIKGKFIGEVVGMMDFNDGINGDGQYSYVNFLSENATQITQIGYPARDFDGDKMVRTDSLGYQDSPNNLIFGSNQTGGSSGSAIIANFGVKTSYSGLQPPKDNDSNQIISTTSWGYRSGKVKIQGGSRFSKNSIFTNRSNIRALVEAACSSVPSPC